MVSTTVVPARVPRRRPDRGNIHVRVATTGTALR
jgi:hypothetical protein